MSPWFWNSSFLVLRLSLAIPLLTILNTGPHLLPVPQSQASIWVETVSRSDRKAHICQTSS